MKSRPSSRSRRPPRGRLQGRRSPRTRRRSRSKATELVSDAIAKGNVQAINYFVANNYVKALESLASAPNQKVIMMPLEASSVIGSIAGLAQLTGEAFGGAPKTPRA